PFVNRVPMPQLNRPLKASRREGHWRQMTRMEILEDQIVDLAPIFLSDNPAQAYEDALQALPPPPQPMPPQMRYIVVRDAGRLGFVKRVFERPASARPSNLPPGYKRQDGVKVIRTHLDGKLMPSSQWTVKWGRCAGPTCRCARLRAKIAEDEQRKYRVWVPAKTPRLTKAGLEAELRGIFFGEDDKQ
ncbi:hypothetical protein AAVH_41806, partial [Aphelenchoides avenae]